MASLLSTVNRDLKETHTNLFDSPSVTFRYEFLEFLRSKKRWWFIPLIVSLVFFAAIFINIDWLNFIVISKATSQIIVDQRTSNIATIISITIAVIGFLLTNLAIKDPFAYQLLFKHSYLYPIIFFILSTIGCFVVISTLRDALPEELFNRLVITGTYLFLLVLVLIGMLFKTIISFANSKQIEKMLHEELMREARHIMRGHLILAASAKEVRSLMSQVGVNEYHWTDDFPSLKSSKVSSSNNAQTKIVADIDLDALKTCIGRMKVRGEVVFNEIGIGSVVHEFVWVKGVAKSEASLAHLKSCLSLKKVPNSIDDSYRKYFDQNLEDAVNNNKHKSVDSLLRSVLELYRIQIKTNATFHGK